jgi:hypothetical protein
VQQSTQAALSQNTDKALLGEVTKVVPQQAKLAEPDSDRSLARNKTGFLHKLFHRHQKNQEDETEFKEIKK